MANKIIAQISTHKAVKTAKNIEIWMKGLSIPIGYKYPNGDIEEKGFHYDAELLYAIPLENEDDVLAIMERYAEDNRVNMAELNDEMK